MNTAELMVQPTVYSSPRYIVSCKVDQCTVYSSWYTVLCTQLMVQCTVYTVDQGTVLFFSKLSLVLRSLFVFFSISLQGLTSSFHRTRQSPWCQSHLHPAPR